ncbi:hypothetical protein D3C85_1580690 [compost metagenome]
MPAQVVWAEFVIVHEGDFANPRQGKMFGHAGPYRATAGNNDVAHDWFSASTLDQVLMILPL